MAELVTKTDLQAAISQIDAKLDNLSLRLTVRLGIMLIAAIGLLGAIVRLT
jgi:hypothetical protein